MVEVKSDDAGLEAAAATLNSGGVAVIPTDTVYGLAAHPSFPSAVERLYAIKDRSARKPIALLASGVEAVKAFGGVLSERASDLAAAHWPGPLTLILPAGGVREGFRVPAHEWTRRLLERCGGVLRVTSANMSGCRPATDAVEALRSVGLDADVVVDGGTSPGGTASAVVGFGEDGSIEILRPGTLFPEKAGA